MLKILLKIRLKALADSLFNRQRRGKSGGKGMKALLIFLLIYCVVVFGGMFGMMFYAMYEPFQMLDMGWLYYSLCGVLATMLCFVGSVFFTQSTLYDAKDNELLLSMPIPSGVILGSRMALLLLLNYGYSLLLTVACGVVRCFVAPVTALDVVRYVEMRSTVPVGVRGVPKGVSFSVYPSTAQAVFRCQFPSRSNPAESCEFYVDYDEFTHSKSGRCVAHCDNLPANVIEWTLEPDVFDCMLREDAE